MNIQSENDSLLTQSMSHAGFEATTLNAVESEEATALTTMPLVQT